MPAVLAILCSFVFASQVGYATEDTDIGTATDTVQVSIDTTLGPIVVALNVKQAPQSANNFLRYVDARHFDDTTFYRTVTLENDNGHPKIEVIQGGINVENPPVSAIEHEPTSMTGLIHVDGAISMARSEPGTASSEFFICIGDQPGLDAGAERNPDMLGFAVFGQVIEGMDVVRRIHQSAADGSSDSEYTNGQILSPPVVIEKIRRL